VCRAHLTDSLGDCTSGFYGGAFVLRCADRDRGPAVGLARLLTFRLDGARTSDRRGKLEYKIGKTVGLELGGLEADPAYVSRLADQTEVAFAEFRRSVERARRMCYQSSPRQATDEEIRQALLDLRRGVRDSFPMFAGYVERALGSFV
jgi:hypothetical protein